MTTIQDLYDMINMFPEVSSNEVFRSAEDRQKSENTGTCIDRLVM